MPFQPQNQQCRTSERNTKYWRQLGKITDWHHHLLIHQQTSEGQICCTQIPLSFQYSRRPQRVVTITWMVCENIRVMLECSLLLYCFARWCLSSSCVSHWARGRLAAARPGAWAVGRLTLHGGPVRLRPFRRHLIWCYSVIWLLSARFSQLLMLLIASKTC